MAYVQGRTTLVKTDIPPQDGVRDGILPPSSADMREAYCSAPVPVEACHHDAVEDLQEQFSRESGDVAMRLALMR